MAPNIDFRWSRTATPPATTFTTEAEAIDLAICFYQEIASASRLRNESHPCEVATFTDPSPLTGLPLTRLVIYKAGASDLRPLAGMPLQEIRLNPRNIAQGIEVLREMKSLKIIGISHDKAWPTAEFWGRYDKGEFAIPVH